MPLNMWRYIAIGGALCILTANGLGTRGLQVVYVLSCVAACASIVAGIKVHRPERPDAWLGLAGAAACFAISAVLRIGFPEFAPNPSGNPAAPEFIDALAYFFAISSIHRLGQVRDKDKDPTTIIDSLIVAGGVSTVMWVVGVVPYLQDSDLNKSGRLLGVTLAVLSTWLAFGAARLAIGPGIKSTTSRLLLIAALFAVLGETATTADANPMAPAVLVFGACAGFLLASAAVHFDMIRLTQAATRPVIAMTSIRLIAMTIAILIAPAIILIRVSAHPQDFTFYAGLVASWIVVLVLVMTRMAGLVRAREKVAQIDRSLSRAAASLVAATDRETTYAAALTAMSEIAGDNVAGLRTSLALVSDNRWIIVDSKGKNSEVTKGTNIDPTLMESMFQNGIVKKVRLDNTIPFDNPYSGVCSVLATPLISHHGLCGALFISTDEPLTGPVVEALEALSSDVSLAIEAIGLAEDLHTRRSEQRFQALIQHSSDLTAVLDISGIVTFISPAVTSVLGHDPMAITGQPLATLVHPEDKSVINELAGLLIAGMSNSKHAELRMQTAAGAWKTLDVTLTDVRHDDSINGLVINAHDITDRKALENDLRHKVLHDDLTGIANRILFRERVEHAINSRQIRNESITAVLFIDVDDFKTVNDGLGHDIGDELLKVVAFRLESFVRSGDTAARLGGDEFAVLIEELYTLDDVMNASHRLLGILNQPIEFGRREITVSASIGVALAEQGLTSEVVMRNSDVAMNHAKQTGKNRVRVFDEAMHVSAFERLELKAELTHALERNELSLHYQPLIEMKSGKLVGFEALMRWTHPTRGFISPASFIPLAEETGLIIEIGAWALIEAFTQLATWRSKYNQDVYMSVNVSPRQLEEERIVVDVQDAIARSGIQPSWATLELTESAGLDDSTKRERFVALRQLGCEIAADDFGTGFASYAALQQLPFTNVKIDRSLITGLSTGDQKAQAQVKSIIQMGHALGLTITAEGIEDSRQADALIVMGADKAQGYLFGRPAPANEAEERFREIATRTYQA